MRFHIQDIFSSNAKYMLCKVDFERTKYGDIHPYCIIAPTNSPELAMILSFEGFVPMQDKSQPPTAAYFASSQTLAGVFPSLQTVFESIHALAYHRVPAMSSYPWDHTTLHLPINKWSITLPLWLAEMRSTIFLAVQILRCQRRM